jgi:hypothetical protein
LLIPSFGSPPATVYHIDGPSEDKEVIEKERKKLATYMEEWGNWMKMVVEGLRKPPR